MIRIPTQSTSLALAEKQRPRPRYLHDLPIEIGGSCTAFLFVQEQCTLTCISKKFQQFIEYGLEMKPRVREKLVVLRKWPIVPSQGTDFTEGADFKEGVGNDYRENLDLTEGFGFEHHGGADFTEGVGAKYQGGLDKSFHDDTMRKLQKLLTIYPVTHSIYCRLKTPLGTLKMYPITTISNTLAALQENAPYVKLSTLATSPSVKHIQSLSVEVLHPRDPSHLHVAAFEGLRTISLHMVFFRAPKFHEFIVALSGRKAMTMKLSTSCVSQAFLDEEGTERMLRALSAWENLRRLELKCLFTSSSRVSGEKVAIARLVHFLPDGVESLSVTVLRVFDSSRDEEELCAYVARAIQSRFPRRFVNSEKSKDGDGQKSAKMWLTAPDQSQK